MAKNYPNKAPRGRANHAVSVHVFSVAHVCKSKHFIRQSPWPAAGPMTGRCKLGGPAEAQRNNQSALESVTPPLPTTQAGEPAH